MRGTSMTEGEGLKSFISSYVMADFMSAIQR